ncbi:hypothetical protein N2152v2_010511 [Parachlorella kessleri]
MLQQLMASGNSQLVAALQKSLNKLVGASSGYIESLPKPVQRRIAFISDIEDERNELEDQYLEERRALEQKYAKLYEPLYAKRAAVVNGSLEAPENETEEAKAEKPEEEVPAGIPGFWAAALSNHPHIEEQITEKDKEVLQYLSDVKVEQLERKEGGGEEEEEGFRLVFSFRPNPFFSNEQLTKTYHLGEDDGETMLSSIEGTDIKWSPGKDVTVKVMKKKPKPGAKSSAKPQTKVEPVESFFHWFKAPELPPDESQLEEEEMEAIEEDMHNDYGLAQLIKDKIVPHALSWFTGEALQELLEQEGEDDEGDDEDEEGEDDEDEDEDEEDKDDEEDDSEDEGDAKDSKRQPGKAQKGAPADAAAQPQECKQQ